MTLSMSEISLALSQLVAKKEELAVLVKDC